MRAFYKSSKKEIERSLISGFCEFTENCLLYLLKSFLLARISLFPKKILEDFPLEPFMRLLQYPFQAHRVTPLCREPIQNGDGKKYASDKCQDRCRIKPTKISLLESGGSLIIEELPIACF